MDWFAFGTGGDSGQRGRRDKKNFVFGGVETKGQTDVDDLNLKLSDALDCCKWRRIVRGN